MDDPDHITPLLAGSADDRLQAAFGFRDHLVALCEGKGKLESESYRATRRALIEDKALGSLIPEFVVENQDTGSLWEYLKTVSPHWAPRRQFVREQFFKMIEHLENEAYVERNIGARFTAPLEASASAWTGRRSVTERVEVIKALAPMAMTSIDELANTLEAARRNEPAYQDAIAALRALYNALGELLLAAENERPLNGAWKLVKDNKDRFLNAVQDGAQVMLVAPALAIGTANILSWLSGAEITGGMLTTLCATAMSKNALLTLAKRR